MMEDLFICRQRNDHEFFSLGMDYNGSFFKLVDLRRADLRQLAGKDFDFDKIRLEPVPIEISIKLKEE